MTAHTVLHLSSVRAAARTLHRPVSTVAEAVVRTEAALATPLIHRLNGVLSHSLMAERVGQVLADISAHLSSWSRAIGDCAAGDCDGLLWLVRHPISIMALERYIEVVEVGSIRRAARNLHMGQPQLSRQIAHIEQVSGRRLLDRTSDGCTTTDIGQRLYEVASEVTGRWRALKSPANSHYAREHKTVRLGTIIPIGSDSNAARTLARLVAEWSVRETGHHLFVTSTTAQELLDGLKSGLFDVAIIDAHFQDAKLEQREIFASELVLVGPRGLADDCDRPDLLQTYRFVVPSRRSGMRRRVFEALGETGHRMDELAAAASEVDSLSVTLRLVLSHGFAAVLPRDALGTDLGHIDVVTLPGTPMVTFHLVWPPMPGARAAAAQLLTILQPSRASAV